ncbi:hypothetical protein F2Q70_00030502 [Brassica cretica]|uniref:Uncharacterized protein n=2 Tax=Brassica cretica TaxID=69181 RepID=A0A8S9FMI1_BRACR|nr:hypothetical protein F2Q70_00030502 [Brassica cretica]
MKTVSDAYSSLPRDELSATLNLDMNNATDVQSIDRTGQTDRAVYRLDPHPSGLELQHNPRLDDQINCTEARLSHPVSHANFIGQAKTEVGRVESESDRGLSLLSCLGRANDHSDELIRHFDQFMNFEQPNISKARLLRLSDDIASICPGTVHENHPSEHEDRYLRVNSLSLSRTCVSNQAAIETSGSIIGSSAALCVTKRSISSQSLRIESISSDPVECSFLRPVSVSVSRTSLTTSSTCFSLSRLDRTSDRSDELIRHFDQFMNFELTNLSKARLLKLSDDLASIWSRTVRENLPSEHEDRTGCVLLLTAGRAVGYIESGHG